MPYEMALKVNLRCDFIEAGNMYHPGIGNPKINEIANSVFSFTKLIHFFADIGVNAGIIESPDSIIFIDCGMSAYSGEFLWNFAEEHMNIQKDLYLIITHKDTDHCFGMNEIKKHGATVISHEHSAEVISATSSISEHPIAKRIKEEYNEKDVLGNVFTSKPDLTISEDTILNLGEEIHILSVPGHTPGDIAVYHPRSKILFAGDSVLEGMDPYIRPDSISINEWIKNLKRLKELEIEWIVPGHGSVSKPDIIDANIGYLEEHG